jgi:fructan beta-fructosidase
MAEKFFHFTPVANWINDPNGMIYYKGEYHLFYQHHPESMNWGPMHWGHAVSTDLINWTHLPIALYPDELGTIFSGSAVIDRFNTSGFFNEEGGIVAIFTHAVKDTQKQSIAYSKDKGRTWIKYEGNPIVPNPGINDFRDPKVIWHEESKRWIMVLAAGNKVMFYGSENLRQWQYLSDFGANEGAHGGVWECPTIFKLPVEGLENNYRWVLKVDVTGGGSKAQFHGLYFIGYFDGTVFINENSPETILWCDGGMDFYAAQDWSYEPGENGRRLWLGWMSNWKYAGDTPTFPWRGAMTTPREVRLKYFKEEGVRLIQKPSEELQVLRKESYIVKNIKNIKCGENLLSDITGKKLEIILEVESFECSEFGFKVRKGANEETVIAYSDSEKSIYVDRTLSSKVDFHPEFAGKHIVEIKSIKDSFKMQVLIDEFSVEVFAEDGKLVMTELIFPGEDSNKIEFFVTEGSVNIRRLEVYNL